MPIRLTRALARRINERPLWRGVAIAAACVAAGAVAFWYVAVVPYQPSHQIPATWPGAERVSQAETLQLAYSYRQSGDLTMAEHLCWQVLLGSGRVEELAAARDLLQRITLVRVQMPTPVTSRSLPVTPPPERVIEAPPPAGQKAVPALSSAPGAGQKAVPALSSAPGAGQKAVPALSSAPGAPLVVAAPRPVELPTPPGLAPGHRVASPTAPMLDTVSASQWLEQWVPSMVQAVANQVATQMVMTGERRITRFYTAQEVQQRWFPELVRRLPATVTQATMEIHPEGVVSLCQVEWLGVAVPLTSCVQVHIDGGRPHLAVSRLAIDRAEVPEDLLRRVEHRVNQIIDQQRLPVRLKSFELREGAAVLSAELV